MFKGEKSRALAFALFAVVVAVSAPTAAWLISRSSAPPPISGTFELTNQNGERVSDRDFRGKLTLIYFGFVFCPDACPTALFNMTDAIDRLGTAGEDVVPILISVDPERDTEEVLRDYAQAFHPRLQALRGSSDETLQAAKAFRMYYRKAPETEPGRYMVDHASIVFLMGRDGRYLTHFTHTTLPEPMAAEIKQRL